MENFNDGEKSGRKNMNYNIGQYFERLNLTEEFLKDKKILDMGCRDGEFIQYLLDNNITKKAYGLDIADGTTFEGDEYEIVLDNDKFLNQSFEDDIDLRDVELITFKSAFYPPMVEKSFSIFKKLVENNLTDDGEIRVEIKLRNPAPDTTKDEDWPLLLAWREKLKNIDENGLNYEIDEEKELLIIRK